MESKHLVLCGKARLSSRSKAWQGIQPLQLRLGKGKEDVHMRLAHLTRALCGSLPDVAVDLIELAAFVYAADQAVTRGGSVEFEYGTHWRRHFRFEMPVRCPDVWQQPAVTDLLARTLGFLSDDEYEFEFSRLADPPPMTRYLFDSLPPEDLSGYEEVMLFSGGLDSLGGAVLEILQGQRKVALVSHRPVSKVYHRQCALVEEITKRLVNKSRRPLHVAVEVNKGIGLDREYTQRTRSFLFASMAAIVACMLGLRRIRFYENGVVSLNLPISPQVLGARASRTTHPRTLCGFEELFGLIFPHPIAVENPFLWDTKAQVLEKIRVAGQADLCAMTSSCAHTHSQTIEHPHCGLCSQCLDRRLSALVAGLSDTEDPPAGYATDVVTGAKNGADFLLAENVVRVLRDIQGIEDTSSFATRFPEVSRVLPHLGLPADQGMERVFELYRRHAQRTWEAMQALLQDQASSVLRCNHPVNSLFSVMCGRSPRRLAAGREPTSTNGHAPSADALELDDGLFEVRWKGKSCFLGNTLEYWVLVRLSHRLGVFVSTKTLLDDVWGNTQIGKSAIARVVCTLRARLRDAGISDILIDGDQKEHYRLVLPAGAAKKCKRFVSDTGNET